ncbi:hypothetical protein PR202_gb26886 [Eleusine coracana subsp. coracana]|uniref:Uncharacterized protein n=1 Tax=Eleusine coracana subsp. coracana TaxID=191504 RepID=A0AAV5FQ19_ELECO|nr:hypothetical protein QOZ80_1BG0053030 [Eleusine coracana subsp. coracana]GJN37888.1 hypothetical protein PR202_gb26886 [Eleusine coracana subsp. coracana]
MDRYRVAPARPVSLSSAGPGGHLHPGRRSGGAEIGIFTAERYFSAADVIKRHDAVLLRPDHPHHDPLPLPLRVSGAASDAASSQSGRHTAASSEASWNSRSGLLSGGAHHSPAVTRMKATSRAGNGSKKSGSGWTLCPCTGRKAVVTVDAASEPRDARFSAQSAVDECIESAIFKPVIKSPPPPTMMSDEEEMPAAKTKVTVTPGTRAFPLAATNVPSEAFAAAIGRRAGGGGGFTFPAAAAARFVTTGGGVVDDEAPRASLEVFRPIDEDSVMVADPPPPMGAVPRGLQDLAVVVVDEEAMSDASSDLFDLESFAASSSYPATSFRGGRRSRRNSDDDDRLPYTEPALSECGMYAPSEASVVWSVATAEGGAFDAASAANFSSAASACGGAAAMEDFRFVVPGGDDEFAAAMSVSRSGAARNKKGGGFLDSCRCEKAVSVGPTPVKMVRPPAYPAAAATKAKKGSAARCHPAGRVHVPVRT